MNTSAETTAEVAGTVIGRVLLVEPNTALRSAIVEVLASEHFEIEECESLNDAMARSHLGDGPPEVALVAWQSMDGLLAEEHRHTLADLNRRLRLVLMVPRRWQRMLAESDLGVAGLIAKPFDADELLRALWRASVRAITADARASS
jgi:DNA-binding response OmpR family regulator